MYTLEIGMPASNEWFAVNSSPSTQARSERDARAYIHWHAVQPPVNFEAAPVAHDFILFQTHIASRSVRARLRGISRYVNISLF